MFEQFHRFANLYFLFIVLLNWVPAVNAFGESYVLLPMGISIVIWNVISGKEISMLPIMIIMLVTSLKDLFEDRKRYLSDKNVNNSSCRVYIKSAAKFESKSWKELQVGDIVHLSNDEIKFMWV